MWPLGYDIKKADPNPEAALKRAAEEAKAKEPEQPKKEETWRDRAISDPTFTRPLITDKRMALCVEACKDLSDEQLESVASGKDLYELIMEMPFDDEPMRTWLKRPIKEPVFTRPL